jgi:dephospho-CoA kinase
MKIVGITGTNGSGKGTVVDIICKHTNSIHLSAREMILDLAKDDGVNINSRDDLRVYNENRNLQGKTLIQEINRTYNAEAYGNKLFIFESIRRVCEINELRSLFGKNFLMVSVDAPLEMRYERIKQRGSMSDKISLEKFIEDERLENESENDSQMNLYRCRDLSEIHLQNTGTMKDLEIEIEDKLLTNTFFKKQ